MQLDQFVEIQKLAEKLDRIRIVAQHNTAEHKENWAIAHGLSDVEESFYKIFLDLIPKLKKEADEKKQEDFLLDIREEFRHIAYHLKDMSFFSDLLSL